MGDGLEIRNFGDTQALFALNNLPIIARDSRFLSKKAWKAELLLLLHATPESPKVH